MNKKAFTIAELLIVMALMGTLAILIFSNTRKIMPNESLVMFKKAYGVTSQVVNALIEDEELYPPQNGVATFTNTNAVTYRGTTYDGLGKFCNLFAAMLNVSSDNKCNDTSMATTTSFKTGKVPIGRFTTADGIVWYVPRGNFTNNATNGKATMIIDINGDAGPNCKYTNANTVCACHGNTDGTVNCNKPEPDRFTIYVRADGRIELPANGPESFYLGTDSNTARFNSMR